MFCLMALKFIAGVSANNFRFRWYTVSRAGANGNKNQPRWQAEIELLLLLFSFERKLCFYYYFLRVMNGPSFAIRETLAKHYYYLFIKYILPFNSFKSPIQIIKKYPVARFSRLKAFLKHQHPQHHPGNEQIFTSNPKGMQPFV